jgi:hypothetical protein
MDQYLIIALIIALVIFILFTSPKLEYHDFILELILEKPYIFILFTFVYFISIVSPLLGILYGVFLLIIENSINSVIYLNENNKINTINNNI